MDNKTADYDPWRDDWDHPRFQPGWVDGSPRQDDRGRPPEPAAPVPTAPAARQPHEIAASRPAPAGRGLDLDEIPPFDDVAGDERADPRSAHHWVEQRPHPGAVFDAQPQEAAQDLTGVATDIPALFARVGVFRVPDLSAGEGEGEGRRLLPAHSKDHGAWFEGPRLSMRDKEVWEQFVAAAWKSRRSGVEFELSLYAVSKGCGGSGGGTPTRRVLESLRRLAASKVAYERREGGATVVQGEGRLVGSLRQAPEATNARKGGAWMVSFDPGLVPLFDMDMRFPSQAAHRKKFRSELHRWLLDFLAPNKAYSGYKLGKLRELSGFAGRREDFHGALVAALKMVVTMAPEVVEGYEIDKTGTSSDDWTLSVRRSDAPKHTRKRAEMARLAKSAGRQAQADSPQPEDAESPNPAAKSPRKPQRRRGGVVL